MIAIIKYNAGNITSVKNALLRLGYECIITEDMAEIKQAEKVIFPGVGEAQSAMQHLNNNGLSALIPTLTQPFLGICLGQQLMCTFSDEGNTACLGIFDAAVKKFPYTNKVPHMGWNTCTPTEPTELFENVVNSENVYFVHSYYCEISKNTIAACDYILPFSAAMKKNNFYAVQFHPEKSATVGEKILKNFLEL